MSWPYCEATGCHDSHTRQYVRTGTGLSSAASVQQDVVMITDGGSYLDTIWGSRLCRAHALLRYGVA